jgi:hypothetical protein
MRTAEQGPVETASLRSQSKDLSSPEEEAKRPLMTPAAEVPLPPSPGSNGSLSPERATQQPRSLITVKNGRLSAWIERRSLNRVLDEIQTKGMVMIIAEGVEDQPVSAQFEDLPLDEGLRTLLQDQDTFFFYGAEDGASASLRAVWVYPKGQGRQIMPVPAEKWASTRELEQELANPDAEARTRAIEALAERQASLDVVLQALTDKEGGVRSRTLYKALDSGIKLPADTLVELALNDSLPEVRFMAFQALAEDASGLNTDDPNSVKALAERVMMNDPAPELRDEAKTVLERLADKPPGGGGDRGRSAQRP